MAEPVPVPAAAPADPAPDEENEGEKKGASSTKDLEPAVPDGSKRLILLGVLAAVTIITISGIGVLLMRQTGEEEDTEYPYVGSTSGFCTDDWQYSDDVPDPWLPKKCTPQNMCQKEGPQSSPIHVTIEPAPAAGENMGLKTAYGAELKHINVTFNKFLYMTIRDATPPTLQLGAVTYFLREVHLRFKNKASEQGSEHDLTSDDLTYTPVATPLEVQLFHVNGAAKDFFDSIKEADGVVALSVLYKVKEIVATEGLPPQPPPDSALDTTLKAIAGNINVSGKAKPGVKLETLVPAAPKSFYTYTGSMTFPPCTVGVKWVIIPDVQEIKSESLEALWNVAITSNSLTVRSDPKEQHDLKVHTRIP